MSDEIRCPICECPRVLAFQQATAEPCGSDHNPVLIFYVRPLLRCLKCNEVWSAHEGEAAQEEALARYRAALCGTPDIAAWIARVKDRALAGIHPDSIEQVVRTWEIHRLTMMVEAGTGIEPARSGI